MVLASVKAKQAGQLPAHDADPQPRPRQQESSDRRDATLDGHHHVDHEPNGFVLGTSTKNHTNHLFVKALLSIWEDTSQAADLELNQAKG